MAHSAMPKKMKIMTLVQEVVRILRNTSAELDKGVKVGFLNELSRRMKISGYPEQIRLDVIKSGIETYEKQRERDRTGICPMYRPKTYKQKERKKKKEINKVSWQRPYETVLFCPPTPNSALANKLRNITKKESMVKIKVVERAGKCIERMLPGLQEERRCGREDCFIHKTGGKGTCTKEGVVYMVECVSCTESGKDIKYFGESERSGYTGGRQHLAAINNPQGHSSNALAKHLSKHPGTETKFKMNIIKTFQKPLQRQIREGVEIYGAKQGTLLNNKMDHYQPALGRVVFTNQLQY